MSQIILKFKYRPEKTVEGGVNGKMFKFEAGKEYDLDYPQWEALLRGGYV